MPPGNFFDAMAYTDNPSGSLIDLVRLKAGDTEDEPILTDNAIQALLDNNDNNVLLAAAEACEALAAHYADNPTEVVGDLGCAITKTQNFLRAADRYRAQAAELKAEEEARPRRPGYSSTALNKEPAFTRGMCNCG
jgi:hypothetical protein